MSVTKLTNSIVWIDKDRNHFSSKSVVTNRSAQTLSITPVFCDWLPTSLGLAKGTSEGEVQKEHSRCADDPESSKSVWSIFFKTCWWTPGCYPLLDYRYTLGRGGDESNILFDQKDPQYKLYKIERGGEVWFLARCLWRFRSPIIIQVNSWRIRSLIWTTMVGIYTYTWEWYFFKESVDRL